MVNGGKVGKPRQMAPGPEEPEELHQRANGREEAEEVHLRANGREEQECNGSEFGEPSSDSGHPYGCIRLRTRILPKLRFGRRLSKETREMIDIGKTPVKSVSRNMVEAPTRCDAPPV